MKKAFILVNTGTPSELTRDGAERFLRTFLSDPEVISAPFFIRYPLARKIARERAGAYLENLGKTAVDGRPRLRVLCAALASKIAEMTAVDTYAAYRYGAESVADAIKAARANGAKDMRFVPMFPQSASATTLSIRREVFAHRREGEIFRFRESYFDDDMYISLLAKSLKKYADGSLPTIASFHSIPVSQDSRTNYSAQCARTAELLRERSGFADISVAWQSRTGGWVKWLTPELESELLRIVGGGAKGVNVIAPGFACDCTETCIEIDETCRAIFYGAGGSVFRYVPCLDDSAEHAVMFSEIFEKMK